MQDSQAQDNQKTKVDIVFVNHGVANRFEDRIEIHKDLPMNRELYDFILDHERKHTDGYTLDDFKLDFITQTPIHIIKLLFKFMIVRPSTWIQLSPVYPSQKQWYIDRTKLFNMILLSLVILGIMMIVR